MDTIDLSGLERLQEAFKRLPEELHIELMDAMEDSLELLHEPVSHPGTRPQPPIAWDTLKQRRAFFLSGGFGRGIPTRRTYAIVTSWKQEIQSASNSNSLIGRLFNTHPAAGYVMGDPMETRSKLRQSSIFIGWWMPAKEHWDYLTPHVRSRFQQAISNAIQRFVS